MITETTQTETNFTLRVPAALNEKLVAEARAENRSRQAHIVYLLNKHFEKANDADGGGEKNKKEKTK